MTTDEENKYVILGISALLFLVVCSLLVKFNEIDALYLLFIATIIIRYLFIKYKD